MVTGGILDGGNPFLDVTTGWLATGISALDGFQSLGLDVNGGPASIASITISQTGTIPSGQNSVSFILGDFVVFDYTALQNPADYFSMTVDNQNVPLKVTEESGGIFTVSGSISQWAGQTVTLGISDSNPIGTGAEENSGVIDDVAFSPQVVSVPEPAAMGVLAAAMSISVVICKKIKTG